MEGATAGSSGPLADHVAEHHPCQSSDLVGFPNRYQGRLLEDLLEGMGYFGFIRHSFCFDQ